MNAVTVRPVTVGGEPDPPRATPTLASDPRSLVRPCAPVCRCSTGTEPVSEHEGTGRDARASTAGRRAGPAGGSPPCPPGWSRWAPRQTKAEDPASPRRPNGKGRRRTGRPSPLNAERPSLLRSEDPGVPTERRA